MRCADLMKTHVECVKAEQTVQEAAARMEAANIGFVPVCDDRRRVLGTLTDRDITVRVVARGEPLDTCVGDIMTGDPVCCQPATDLDQAARLMRERKVSRIVCVDDADRLVGVISLSDIAQSEDERLAARTLRDVSSREASAEH
jgi:CBS domain-containing protein